MWSMIYRTIVKEWVREHDKIMFKLTLPPFTVILIHSNLACTIVQSLCWGLFQVATILLILEIFFFYLFLRGFDPEIAHTVAQVVRHKEHKATATEWIFVGESTWSEGKMKMISCVTLPGGRRMWGCLKMLYLPRWVLLVEKHTHLWSHLSMLPMFLLPTSSRWTERQSSAIAIDHWQSRLILAGPFRPLGGVMQGRDFRI